ncbi:hypothetical protein [Kitasatospora sp. NPDC001175]|uniref:hypothetical protein n=1 Tax=Kitasatospora sp. NPDC001175 TaxID=3157103 RepID=UPI003D0820CD
MNADTCPRCLHRDNPPWATIQTHFGTNCRYHCPNCRHTWHTTWASRPAEDWDEWEPRTAFG